VLIVFSLYLIVLKILFEKGFEKKKRIKQNRKEIGNRKKKKRSLPGRSPSIPFPSPRPSAAQEARALIPSFL
jgi:hypothetical protein